MHLDFTEHEKGDGSRKRARKAEEPRFGSDGHLKHMSHKLFTRFLHEIEGSNEIESEAFAS